MKTCRSLVPDDGRDPALRRKLLVLRVLAGIALAGLVTLVILTALTGEFPTVSGRSSHPRRPTTWEDSPVLFLIRAAGELFTAVVAVFFFYLLFHGFIRRTHGRPVSDWWKRGRRD